MKKLIGLLCLIIVSQVAFPQQRRAIIIGINNYLPPATPSPRKLQNLRGAVNDARAMDSVLLNTFDYSPTDINLLVDTAATRAGILNSLNEMFVLSKSGDQLIFYFAGHGSQVYNSLSPEEDHLDETIVPVDALLPGIKDIRDKELSLIFYKFLKKGVALTTIFDCCHSGSISKGSTLGNRSAPKSNYDVMDAGSGIVLENNTDTQFITMSAVQDNELAEEISDSNNKSHGAFTAELLNAINSLPNTTSALNIFKATSARLKDMEKLQHPVLKYSRNSQNARPFNIGNGSTSSNEIMIRSTAKPFIFLEAGLVHRLRIGDTLVYKQKGQEIKIRIDSVMGPGLSRARLLKGLFSGLHAGLPFVKTTQPPGTLALPDSYNKTARLQYWTRLKSPATSRFPFHLELLDDSNKLIKDNRYLVKQHVNLHVVPDLAAEKNIVSEYFIYAFIIDPNGDLHIAFPNAQPGSSSGNDENKFPLKNTNGTFDGKRLFGFTADEPTGSDNFFLLATTNPITDFESVVSMEQSKGSQEISNLARAFKQLKNKEEITEVIPENWSLLKLVATCIIP